MATITAFDGTPIFYKDWGSGRPVVFSHGWPLNADAWDAQLRFVADNGLRGIAHDRRGHGRSGQPWNGNDMDTYADDLAALIQELDLRDAVLVGHSTGGGEVVRYLGRHGTGRVSKAVLLGAVPPFLLQTEDNPQGAPIGAFDSIRDGVERDRSQYYKDLTTTFYNANREGVAISDGTRDAFWLAGMQVGLKAAYDCIAAFSETDFRADLLTIDIPVLVVHGDDDQIVPVAISAVKTAERLKDATLKVYEGAPHGIVGGPYQARFHADLLDFITS